PRVLADIIKPSAVSAAPGAPRCPPKLKSAWIPPYRLNKILPKRSRESFLVGDISASMAMQRKYQYDSLGQVTNGVKYFYDNTLVPGQQFNYTFDTTCPVRYGKIPLCLRPAQSDRWQLLRWPHAGFAQPNQSTSGGRGAVNENASAI
ncbi:MAG: hypothetical protein P4N59_25485, partial [Negativicutes bacterium]|nr:hypothetical protein [Negativicutes bacterium]